MPNDTLPPPEYATIIAIIFIGGFAIQQLLQIIDFFVEWLINKLKDANGLIYGVVVKVFKTSLMLSISSLLGAFVALTANIRLLSLAFPSHNPPKPNEIHPDFWLEILVSALVIGSGTEAVNMVMKFLGYIKEAQKADTIDIKVEPSSAAVVKGITVKFRAIVTNGDNSAVDWSVIEGNGGKIDSNGLYTAPADTTGTFHVLAVSRQDRNKSFTATVTVSNPA